MLKDIRKLSGIYGPSGCEDLVRDQIKKDVEAFADKIYPDIMGNLVVFKKGRSALKKLMFTAHMDQIGLIITEIGADGFLRFSKYGDLCTEQLQGAKISFKNGVTGIIAAENNKENLFIDIGCSNGAKAQGLINIGDIGVFKNEAEALNDAISGSALDNRAGCVVLTEVIKNSEIINLDTYFVFTVQNVIGARGAKIAASYICPDAAVSVDAVMAQDLPKARSCIVKLGNGPVIKLRDSGHVCHAGIKDMLISAAIKGSLPYQLDATISGVSDSASMHISKEGIPTGIIAIPMRYIHSPYEVCNKEDLKMTAELIKAVLDGTENM